MENSFVGIDPRAYSAIDLFGRALATEETVSEISPAQSPSHLSIYALYACSGAGSEVDGASGGAGLEAA